MYPGRIAGRIFAVLLVLSAACFGQNAELTLDVNPSAPGIKIPSNFLGFSFETSAILPQGEGKYLYFRSSNRPLITLFHTLGIKSLRIGGNTADRPGVKVPARADIDELFAFSRLAGTRVIYTLRLRDSTPEQDAPIAKYLMERYSQDIDCLVVGNEPNVYEKQYAVYRGDLQRYLAALTAPGVAPHARFCGPSTTPNAGSWAAAFVHDFGATGRILWVTQHSYPAGNGETITDPAAERLRLLSPELAQHDEQLYDYFGPAVLAAGMKYRIEETNSFYNGGAEGVSNTFASALWGLDYLYWWAERHSQGVNFHTGDEVAAGGVQRTCWYAAFTTAANGYEIHPLAYAMKAFDLTGHGTLLPVSLSSPNSGVSAHAVRAPDGELYLTLISKAHGPAAQPLKIMLNPAARYRSAESMLLLSPQRSLAATTGITLGGASIQSDGLWEGRWSPLQLEAHRRLLTLEPDTALLVRLKPAP